MNECIEMNGSNAKKIMWFVVHQESWSSKLSDDAKWAPWGADRYCSECDELNDPELVELTWESIHV